MKENYLLIREQVKKSAWFLVPIEILYILVICAYFGYIKPLIVIPNGLDGLLISDATLKTSMIAIYYLQLLCLLLSNALFAYKLFSIGNVKSKSYRILKTIYNLVMVISISLFITNILIDYFKCSGNFIVFNIIEAVVIVALFAAASALGTEFKKYYLLQISMKDYI